jgi:SAM-dependent methyltransferase
MIMNQAEIQAFWNQHPCGDSLMGGLGEKYDFDYDLFFRQYDDFRYRTERHILRCLDNIDFRNKRVLEIGLGQGADSEQIIRRGASWSGLDLTDEAVNRVGVRLSLRKLPYKSLKRGSAIDIPFDDDTFDIVFSHGVLHHIPDIRGAQKEIARVLKPDGELIIMVYAKWSLNYILAISIIRRVGLLLLYAARCKPGGIFEQHLANAREIGLWRYLRMANFIHKNTDGPLNPYSKVYTLAEIKRDFPNFSVAKAYKCFLHAPPLRVKRLPFSRVLGWHLWVHLKPKA